jgi:hypothetical protein
MELIALPLTVLMLLFLVPGFILARSALSAAQEKLSAKILLISVVLIELFVNSCGPLLISYGGKIYGWSLFIQTFCCYFFSAIILGPSMYFIYRGTKNNLFRIIASSVFLSAGLFPVAWFKLTDLLTAAFRMKLAS